MPANSGVASLVPQLTYQPASSPGKVLVGVDQTGARAAHSDVRHSPVFPVTLATLFW